MSKKITAVEWLVKEFSEILGPLKTKPMQDLLIVDAINQAKQMEKEQIIDAHNHGFTEGTCFGASQISYKFIESEQYYNETFNTKEK